MAIRSVESLQQHLQTAIELEHSTLPPYLCALYSLKDGSNKEARAVLQSVALEEMLHLTLAANVLNAVGGTPVLDSPRRMPSTAVSPAFIGPGRMWENQVARQAAAGSQYFASDPEQVAEQMIGMVPLRRYGSVREVATAVAFLLSEEASYITGVNLEVSGGSA